MLITIGGYYWQEKQDPFYKRACASGCSETTVAFAVENYLLVVMSSGAPLFCGLINRRGVVKNGCIRG